MSGADTPAIGYDELLAAHREAIAQRDLARRVAVGLERDFAHAEALLLNAMRLLYRPFAECAIRAAASGIPVRDDIAAMVAEIEAARGFAQWDEQP